MGVFWGAFTGREPETNRKNFVTMFAWYEAKKLAPIVSQRFPLERAKDAMRAILAREVVGKCVIITRG